MSINNLNTYLNIKDSHLRVVSGNVYAQAMNIGGINVETAHGLQSVSNTGNVTSNTLQFSNAITGFVTTANAQIGRDLVVSGNTTVSTDLTVSANATVADTLTISEHLIASKEATITGNLHVTTIRSDSNVVTEYTGPHDRPLRKYPEVVMTANSDKGYVVSGSTRLDATGNYEYYKAFDNVISTGTTNWISASSTFDGSGDPTGTSNTFPGTSYRGEYCALKLPNAIKLDNFHIFSRGATYSNPPKDLRIFGSNDGTTWTNMKQFQNLSFTGLGGLRLHVNDSNTYNEYAFFVEKITVSSGGATYCAIGELELYGHEEGSGSLDTTLKTVYNVPATTGTQLEVYYDAKGESTVQSPIPDLSPNTNTGALSTPPPTLDTTDGIESFKFNGSSQYINAGNIGVTAGSGEYPHSMSAWIKIDTLTSTMALTQIGSDPVSAGNTSIFYINTLGNIILDISGGSNTEWYSGLLTNQWYHVSYTYNGGASGKTPVSYKLYINGVDQGHQDTGAGSGTLNLVSGSTLAIGSNHLLNGNFFDGSVANFRHYSKILNADQVKELYDYQKDYFLGSKSQVTLYKGHLGVGVTEPSGQLELAGDERIQEYPPGPLGPSTSYETHVPGHGVFCWDTVNYYPGSPNENYNGSGMYAKDGATTGWYGPYQGQNGYTSGDVYAGTDFAATSSSGLGFNDAYGNRYYGAWTTFKLPYKINLKKIHIDQWATSDGANARCAPEDGVILGSNNGVDWYHVHTFTGLQYGGSAGNPSYSAAGEDVTITCTTDYSQYALVVTRTLHYAFTAMIGELRWFGTPGPTTLDKGSLTLGRSLDVPRVSRYDVDTETPRPEKLLVDFDTTVNSSPTDISGKGHHGTFKNDSEYSTADKAFKFAAANAHIYLEQGTISGTSATHTFSLWINALSGPGNGSYEAIFEGGVRSNNQAFGLYAYQDGSNTRVYYHVFGSNLPSNTAGYIVNTNSWYHICGTLDNSGNVRRFYVNGELFASDTYGSLNVTHPRIRIGQNVDGSESWHGMVSNFKLYDVALEPSEVKKLYNLGRTGRSMVISDTAVGIGKVPEAQLDVRGNIKTSGMVNNAGMRWYINGDGGNAIYTVGENWFSSNGASNVYGTVKKSRNGADVSAWDATTGFFTAPEDGIYSIDLVMFINGFDGSRWGGFQLQNSAGGAEETTYTFYTANISTDDTMSYSKTVYMEKGWKFRFYTPAGTVTLYISGMHSSLNIHKIS